MKKFLSLLAFALFITGTVAPTPLFNKDTNVTTNVDTEW